MTDEEFKQAVKDILAKDRSQETVKEAFRLYNLRFTPRQTKLFCGGCVNKVYRRLEQFNNNP